jgi:hypothetical protein
MDSGCIGDGVHKPLAYVRPLLTTCSKDMVGVWGLVVDIVFQRMEYPHAPGQHGGYLPRSGSRLRVGVRQRVVRNVYAYFTSGEHQWLETPSFASGNDVPLLG